MIFFNFSPEVDKIGNKGQIRLGGNQFKSGLIISCPEDADPTIGLNKKYTVVLDANGCPEIVKQDDDPTIYFLLSSEGKGKDRLGNGTIMILKNQCDHFKTLLVGENATVRYGIHGKWTSKLLQLRSDNAVIRVRFGYNLPEELYIIHNGEIFSSSLDESSNFYKSTGICMPYKTDVYSLEHDWTAK
jgi:hypothetical protein